MTEKIFKDIAKMSETELNELINKRCQLFEELGEGYAVSLKAMFTFDGILGGPHSKEIVFPCDGKEISIKIEQCAVRIVTLSAESLVPLKKLLAIFTSLEKLIMLFDGRFYDLRSLSFEGNCATEEEYAKYVAEFMERRPSYYKSDRVYCYSDHRFLNFYDVLTSDLLSKWLKLEDDLGIVHQVALYNIADTGITHDVKCAYFIESLESMAEIVNDYEKCFPDLKFQGRNRSPLKDYIDAVIPKYGEDIFSCEREAGKEKFTQILVNTRHRMMHIKRLSAGKYLSGQESVLYLVKLCHLYRVVLLSLLGIDYELYKKQVIISVKKWNAWNGICDSFIKKLICK